MTKDLLYGNIFLFESEIFLYLRLLADKMIAERSAQQIFPKVLFRISNYGTIQVRKESEVF